MFYKRFFITLVTALLLVCLNSTTMFAMDNNDIHPATLTMEAAHITVPLICAITIATFAVVKISKWRHAKKKQLKQSLYQAIINNDLKTVEDLLNQGADPDTIRYKDKNNKCLETAFSLAVKHASIEIITLLLEHSANRPGYKPWLCSPYYVPPFYEAIKRGDLEIIKLLISYGFPFEHDITLERAMRIATENKNQEVIDYLHSLGITHIDLVAEEKERIEKERKEAPLAALAGVAGLFYILSR